MSSASILVVDDNKHMRHLLRTMLRALGLLNVSDAGTVVEALEIMQANPPDLLIVDYSMPEIGGAELVRMIRREHESRNPFMPVLMITGHPTKRVLLDARDSGADEILAKPISAAALQERLASLTLKRREFIRAKHYFGPDRRRFRGLQIEPEAMRRATDEARAAADKQE